eukprot:scaffold6.g2907.t1
MCHRDLSSTVRIKCSVCPDFDLCVDCFRVGAELKVTAKNVIIPHSNDHGYRVLSNLSFPVYHPDWGADEEMLLLEAVELYGLGNWSKVAEHVGKTGDECWAHYFAVYVDTGDAFPLPLPDPTMAHIDIAAMIEEHRRSGGERMAGQHAGGGGARPRGAAAAQQGCLGIAKSASTASAMTAVTPSTAHAEGVKQEGEEAEGGARVKQEPGADGPPAKKARREAAGGGSAAAAQGAPAATQQQQQQQQGARAGPAQMSVRFAVADDGLGTPLGGGAEAQAAVARREFDPEYDNEAETIISELADFRRVACEERARRGENSPASLFELGGHTARRGAGGPGAGARSGPSGQPGARPLHGAALLTLAPRCAFSLPPFRDEDSPEEMAQKDRLLQIYNRRLDERERRREFILQRGLLNVKKQQVESGAQQSLDRKRTAAERELHGQLRVIARYLPQEHYEALAEGLVVERRLRARIAELQEYRAMGLRTFEQARAWYGAVDEYEASPEAQRRREAAAAAAASSQATSARSKLNRVPVDEAALEVQLAQGLGAAHAAAALHTQRQTLPDGRGAGLQRERQLCACERYLPAQYLAVKALALRMQEEGGAVSRAAFQAGLPYELTSDRSSRLHAFFVQMGWIKDPAAAAPGAGSTPRTR